MFVCEECGAVFDVPHTYVEYIEPANTWHTWVGCPECGGTLIAAVDDDGLETW